ncbi:MAG: anti-sigma regulatory factor [Cyanobacteriota bacterium]|nr:anti-sigma regulatory factor [Cyanobacteriota bacterium]
MIAISLPATRRKWETLSFASTLYLYPILDLLLADIPREWEPELRLGLQEALVNAAVHGNKLDPSKTIVVQFSMSDDFYSWVISDEGCGFDKQCGCPSDPEELLPSEEAEKGRGLCLLYQIFDRVDWNQQGNQLRLCKQVKGGKNKRPLF